MPKKRSRKRRGNAAPLVALAFLLLAAVAWAIFARQPHRREPAPHSVAAVTPAPTPPALTATASPPVTPTPLAAATATPQASPQPSLPALAPSAHAQVAIIIDDCGQWLDTERALIALPIPITLSVLPDVRYTATIAREASAAGKGVMLHLPMEPISHIYPGPGEIKDSMTDAEITAQTQEDLAQVPLAKGANNHEGSESTADERVMEDVMAVLKTRGLFFVDSRTTAKTLAAQIAHDDGMLTANRDVFLDNKPEVAYTESMLAQAVRVAQRNGSAIAIGHPKPTTLAAIRDYYPKMEAAGVRFVLVQDLVH